MLDIHPIRVHDAVVSGVTMVDTSELPWPGATFSQGSSAAPTQVERSYELLADTLGSSRASIRGVTQVHGTAVAVHPQSEAVEADAVITDLQGDVIGVKIADCLAALIYDPRNQVIAAVHSGWRGTSQNIAGHTVRTLCEGWGSLPGDLWVGLTPSASGRNYEVGRDVHDVLAPWCEPRPSRDERWLFDNQAAVVAQLVAAGVLDEQITRSDICTMEDHRFHSHRRDRERAGRCFAFISMR